jgi:hypothetical protein
MFIAALFTIAKPWKQPRCPTTDEWIKKMWYLYTMEIYSASKKKEILSFTSKWMELENIIWSEVSQDQILIFCFQSSTCWDTWKSQFIVYKDSCDLNEGL